jgi:hypothetical protein
MNNKIINIICAKNRYLILPTLLIFEHLLLKKEEVYLLVDEEDKDVWKILGCEDGKDFIVESELKNIISSNDSIKINFIFHHFVDSFEKLKSSISNLEITNDQFTISFFPDGYTNLFISHGELRNKVSGYMEMNFSKAYFFDVIDSTTANKYQFIKHEIVSSNLAYNIFDKYNFRHSFDKIFSNLTSLNSSIVLLALRPWGSSSFHAGQYKLANGGVDLYNITKYMLKAIAVSLDQTIKVLIRGSARDIEIEKQFYDCISEEGLELIELISLDCENTEGQWHSSSEIKIDKLGYVITNGVKSKNFWDGKITSDKKPLRIKVRNISGDETIKTVE